MPIQRALRKSPLPYGLAIVVALVAGIAALVLWHSWEGSPREPGQMNATETGPSRATPGASAQETN